MQIPGTVYTESYQPCARQHESNTLQHGDSAAARNQTYPIRSAHADRQPSSQNVSSCRSNADNNKGLHLRLLEGFKAA